MVDQQLVIFDCDGVLVDSEVISNDVLARSLTAEGLPTTLAGYAADGDEEALRAAGAECVHALDELPALLGLG